MQFPRDSRATAQASRSEAPHWTPSLTVVVVVRDRATELARCLSSLQSQQHGPDFEIIVVDDGSTTPVADELDEAALEQIVLVRQIPLGIAAARNRGLGLARGASILFVDSDCLASPRILTELSRCLAEHHEDVAFQLRIASGDDSIVGRIEDLRLAAIQQRTRTDDGHIGYLNTSGFGLRSSFAMDNRPLFDTSMVRGEDTALLAKLVQCGRIPRFVEAAVVDHRPGLGLGRYILKHFWIGYHSRQARLALDKTAHSFLSESERAGMFASIASSARKEKRTNLLLLALVACHGLERLGRGCHALFGISPDRQRILEAVVDPVREPDLIARLLTAAEHRQPIGVTYVTAWSLVQSHRDPAFKSLLSAFDIVYADGMGVVLALMLTRFRRCRKVTAGDFFGSPARLVGAA